MAKQVAAAAAEAGHAAPASTQKKLWPVCELFHAGFRILDNSRQVVSIGMAGSRAMPLQYSEIAAYAKDNGFADPESLQEFVTLMYAMDAVYLEEMATRANLAAAANKPPDK